MILVSGDVWVGLGIYESTISSFTQEPVSE